MRNGATTYFHEAGTCRMGKDAQAVVDAKLRVNGVQNLRIADSSIMPRIPAVATMASCALIGERMAEISRSGVCQLALKEQWTGLGSTFSKSIGHIHRIPFIYGPWTDIIALLAPEAACSIRRQS